MYVVVFDGLIFVGGKLERIFTILFSRSTCNLPIECILIKEQFEDDNFTSSKVTTNYSKFCPSIITVYMVFVIMMGNCMVKSTLILCGVYH